MTRKTHKLSTKNKIRGVTVCNNWNSYSLPGLFSWKWEEVDCKACLKSKKIRSGERG